MGKSVPLEGKSFPRAAGARSGALDRLASFRVSYAAIFAFLLLYVFTVKAVEQVLDAHFERAVAAAAQVDPADGSIVRQIQVRVGREVRDSRWVRLGGVRVSANVLGADGRTLLYGIGLPLPSPDALDPFGGASRAEDLLPAITDVLVSVPHNSLLANAILVTYAALLVWTLFVYNRRLARREDELIRNALEQREAAAARAERIESELAELHDQLEAQGEEGATQPEMQAVRQEREALQQQLDALARREAELRAAQAGQARALDEERRALEELLDEAMEDLARKDGEIHDLEARLRRTTRAQRAARQAREGEQLARRLRALYRNLEVDDRAIQDLVALGDEAMKLKAEEGLKRLCDGPDGALVRRKVGGLPPQLSIFELGFAGKGRIYYTRGRQRRYRILAVGAKNTQKTDLEYLSRLPTDA